MPPTASKRIQIVDALVAVLRGMTDPDVYNYPVLTDDAVTTDPTRNLFTENDIDLPAYKVEPTPEGRREYWPANQVVEFFRVNIEARVDAAGADSEARLTAWENLAADLETALAADTTLGGLVYDVRLLTPQPFVQVGSNVVILVQPIETRVHRTFGAP